MKEVRVAIIGAGTISHRHMNIYAHIQQHAAQLGFTAKVVACAEIIPERLKAWGERYGFDEKDLYTDFREMLKRDDIDTVDVCTFHNLHTPISIMAMKAGYDVYCEKPSAATYHDAKMAIDCAKALGRKFHVQMSSVMTHQTRVAKHYVDSGKLGNVYYVNLETTCRRRRPGLDFPEFATAFYNKRLAGHGQAIDGGVYVVGQMLHILGNPKLLNVNGCAARGVDIDERMVRDPEGFGVEDMVDGLAKYENGLNFHFLLTSALNFRDYDLTYIAGSKAGLEITFPDMGGGAFAQPMGAPPMRGGFRQPGLKFYGTLDGENVDMDLSPVENGRIEQLADPNMLLYNDNQVMWLAYKLGILNDETRYNTPETAAQQLLFTDGIFLSQELGRSVTADEIVAMSPELMIREQEIDGQLVKYDLSF